MPSLHCSVVDPAASSAPIDLDVSGPEGTTWADVVPHLARAAGLPEDVDLALVDEPVPEGALLGHPPLLHGALLVVAAAPTPLAWPRGLLQLHVVGGPDAGRIHVLRPGLHRIGRSPRADVHLSDPDASRQHASLSVDADGVRLRDLGSVNGTSVDGVAVDGLGQQIGAGQRIQVGASTLTLRSPGVRPAITRSTGRGTLEVNRAPRPRPYVPAADLRRPPPPAQSVRHRWPWTAMLLPVAVALPICLVTRQPTFLLFALMSPVMMVANAFSERTRGRRDLREAHRSWQDEEQASSLRITSALADELVARRTAAPDAGELLRAVTRPTARLWERGPGSTDVLDLLLGAGRVASGVRVSDADGTAEPQQLDDAPVVVPLLTCGHLGIAGPRAQVLAVARHLVCQLAAWHGPHLVQLVVLASDDASAAQWAWARWLPHLRGGRVVGDLDQAQSAVSALLDLVRERSSGVQRSTWPGPHTVLVVDPASALRSLPGLADLLVEGPCVGIHSICLDDDLAGLAGECRATFEILADGGRLVSDEVTVGSLRWDGVNEGWAERVARALAALRDATPQAGVAALPGDVRLVDLLSVDATDPAAILQGWRQCPASTAVVIGVDADGPAVVDLRRDGPHVLVAGTTGAGKSELLQTLVAALAVANRPDEMSFVLVDYKGGAAFSGCADLPHTAGLVTDLDAQLAERALTSLRAELTRRELALKALGCKDIEAYQAARLLDPLMPPLGRLVVVIDEFRLLAEELPSFVSGLVRVAAVGRSLGVHLVLATQRPAGIVSADIKANVNLRIALRVRDRADSDDVIDAPDAARIDASSPGRALCRGGSGPLWAVQVARVGGSSGTVDDGQVVVRRADTSVVSARVDAPATGDLARIVAALREATTRAQIQPGPPAWLAPLPRILRSDAVPVGGSDDGIALGLVDQPGQQQQPALRWHPVHDGHLGLCGGPRSGRTTALASIALGLCRSWSPDDLHLHVIDAASGQLRGLAALPHTGTVLTADQPRLVNRLVTRLRGEVRRRLDQPTHHPPLVLLIDGWDALVESLDALDHGRTTEALTALLRDGRPAGLRAVVAGDRALLTSRLTAVVPERLLLRVTDPTDLLLAGLPSSAVASDPPPGRAVRTRDGAAVQLSTPCVDGDLGAALDHAAGGARAGWPAPPSDPALRIAPLPTSVRLDQVSDQRPSGRRVLLGVGGDEGLPLWLDLDVDPLAIVAGPSGSGRSTTLHTLAASLHRGGVPVVAVCPRPGALDAGPWPVLGPLDADRLAARVAAAPLGCVVVDDAELLADTAVDGLLDALARRRGPTALVLGGSTSALLSLYRGAAVTARTARTGVLLSPTTPSDGELLGVRAELSDRTAPGRGVLVVRGEQQPVQLGRLP